MHPIIALLGVDLFRSLVNRELQDRIAADFEEPEVITTDEGQRLELPDGVGPATEADFREGTQAAEVDEAFHEIMEGVANLDDPADFDRVVRAEHQESLQKAVDAVYRKLGPALEREGLTPTS